MSVDFRHIRTTVVVGFISASAVVASSCSSPSSPSGTSTAVISGHVTTTSGGSSGRSSSLPSAMSGGAIAAATTTLTVSINGTNISSTVDGNGNFQLTGVPPGDVTLMFSGPGVSASIMLAGVPAAAQVNIMVTLNGNAAHLDHRDDQDENDENDNNHELEGVVSNRANACPNLTFTVQNTPVTTNSSTRFDGGQCAQIANGTRVEVDGTRQADNSILARSIEIN